jgi:DNA-binding NarL/FixJ family response regulator
MDIIQILTNKYPGKEWNLVGNEYEGLEWLDSSPKPTKQQLESQWAEVQQIIEQRQANAIAARQSALAKLAALGLTEAEIAAL